MENEDSNVIGGCAVCDIPNFHERHEKFEHIISLAHHLKLDEQSKSHRHHCDLCRITVQSIHNYVTHLEGKKHRKALNVYRKRHSRKHKNCESNDETKADGAIEAKRGGDPSKERDLWAKVASSETCNGTGGRSVSPTREGHGSKADRAEEVERLEPDGEAEFGSGEDGCDMWQGGGARQGYWHQQWSYQGSYRGCQNHRGYYQQSRYNSQLPGYQQQWRSYGRGGGGVPPFRGMQFHHQQMCNWNRNTYRYGRGQEGAAFAEGDCRDDVPADGGWIGSCYGGGEASKKAAEEAQPSVGTVSSTEKIAEQIKKERDAEKKESRNSEGAERREPKSHLIFLSSEEEEETGDGKGKKRPKVTQEAGATAQKKAKGKEGKAATGTGGGKAAAGSKGPATPRTPPMTSGGTGSSEAFRKDVLDRLVNFPCSRRLRSQLSKWVTQLKKAPQHQSQHPDRTKSTLTLFSAQNLDLQGLVKEMEAGDLPDELLRSLMSALDEGSDAEHEPESAVCGAAEGPSQAKAKESIVKKTVCNKSVDVAAEPAFKPSITTLTGAKPSGVKPTGVKASAVKASTVKASGAKASTIKTSAVKASAVKASADKVSVANISTAKVSTAKSATTKPATAKSTPKPSAKPSTGKVQSAEPRPKPSSTGLPPLKPVEFGQPKVTLPTEMSGEKEDGKEKESEEECIVVPTPAKVVESVELTDSEDEWPPQRSSSIPEVAKSPKAASPRRTPVPVPPREPTPREEIRSRPPSVTRPSSAPTGCSQVTTPCSSETPPRPVSAPKGSVPGDASDLLPRSQEDRKVGGEVGNGFLPQQVAEGAIVGIPKKEDESGEENPRALVAELIALCQEEEQVRTQCALAQRNIAALKSAIDQWKLKEEELLAREEQMRKKRLDLLRALKDSVGAVHGRAGSAAAEEARLFEVLKKPPVPPVADVAGTAAATDEANVMGVTYLGSLDTTLDIMQQILPHMQQLGDVETPPVAALTGVQDAQAVVPPIQLNLRGNVKRKRSAEIAAKTKKTKPSRTDLEADLDESRLKDVPATLEIKAHEGAVVALKLHKGYVFTCSTDHTAKRFDLSDPSKCIVYGCHSKALSSLEVQAAKGAPTLLYTACRDGFLRCFDADSGQRALELDLESPIGCTAAAWGRLYVGLHSGQVVVFNLKGQQVMERYTCSEGPVGRLCTAAEGAQRLLCTLGADGRVGVRDAATGLLLRCLGSEPGGPGAPALVRPPACLALAGGFVYTASSDRNIMVHELRTGNLQKVYEAKSSATGMRVYKNYLLCCSFDGLIRCYRLRDFLCDVVYYGAGKNMVMSMDTCGPLIATGNRKGLVELITFDKSSLHPCEVGSCSLQFGREEDLVHHLKREHLAMGASVVQARCPWQHCNMAFVGPTSSKDFEKHLMDHACV